MPLPALLPELPTDAHFWTVDHELVEDVAHGGWVTRFPTGRGWARCSCGLRIEGPTGDAVPLALVEQTLAHHLGGQDDDDARETGP
jgi:hypothetical protein